MSWHNLLLDLKTLPFSMNIERNFILNSGIGRPKSSSIHPSAALPWNLWRHRRRRRRRSDRANWSTIYRVFAGYVFSPVPNLSCVWNITDTVVPYPPLYMKYNRDYSNSNSIALWTIMLQRLRRWVWPLRTHTKGTDGYYVNLPATKRNDGCGPLFLSGPKFWLVKM